MALSTKAQRQLEDNIATEHFYQSPFRWLAEFLRAIIKALGMLAMVGLLALCVLFNNVMWIFNLGHISASHRQEQIAATLTADDRTWPIQIVEIDFNQPWNVDNPDYYEFLPREEPCTAGPVPIVALGNLFYWSWDLDQEDTRSTRSLDRKANRMLASWNYALLMRDAIHYSLSVVKRHPNLTADAILRRGSTVGTTFCSPRRPDSIIKMTGAPTVKARALQVSERLHHKFYNAYTPYSLSGFCLEKQMLCGDESLQLQVGPGYSDLFSKVPVLGPGQEATLYALNYLSTNAYWLKTAHENGITDDRKVLALAQNARDIIAAQVAPEGSAVGGFTLPAADGSEQKPSDGDGIEGIVRSVLNDGSDD